MTIFGRARVPTELSADERSAAADTLGPCQACCNVRNPRRRTAIRDVGDVTVCIDPVACRLVAQLSGIYANPDAIAAHWAGRTKP